jgi:hypothetical protein
MNRIAPGGEGYYGRAFLLVEHFGGKVSRAFFLLVDLQSDGSFSLAAE